jgi:hypothetical protein
LLFFAHTGITLGVVELLSAFSQGKPRSARENVEGEIDDPPSAYVAEGIGPTARAAVTARPRARRMELVGRIDYRLVLIGSLLPDIVDKPVGAIFLAHFFSNGRILGHTVLFSLILGLTGMYLYRKHGKRGLLVLALGSFLHLVLDQMWLDTRTLLWPLYGWSFAPVDISDWFPRMLQRLVTDPQAFIPEIIGGLIIAQFAVRLLLAGSAWAFVRSGSPPGWGVSLPTLKVVSQRWWKFISVYPTLRGNTEKGEGRIHR